MPRYPVREAVLADPELLKNLPLRWRACRQAAIAAGLTVSLAIAVSGCATESFVSRYEGATQAPAIGEEDALAKIEGFLKTYQPGIIKNYDVHDVTKPIIDVYPWNSSSTEKYVFKETKIIDDGLIDFYNPSSGIGIEYVGDGDSWGSNTNSKEVAPDKSNAYILAISKIDINTMDTEIRQKIEDFLDWLKAEGIGD
jgi:hypothetical protein